MKTALLHRVPHGNPRLENLTAGFRRHGWNVEVVDRRGGAAAIARCDIFVRTGMHWRDEPAASAARIHGKQVWVTDLGYLCRSFRNGRGGYYQLGIGRIGWTPPTTPADRLDALGLDVPEVVEDESKPWLACGQVNGDSQHKLTSIALIDWLARTSRALGINPVYRPHPGSPQDEGSRSFPARCEHPDIATAIAESRGILTYNSTCGIDAMLAGRLAISHPSCWWHEAGLDRSRENRVDFLRRVAYAQWTLAEFADGSAIEYLSSLA